jgi:hypothetical protein
VLAGAAVGIAIAAALARTSEAVLFRIEPLDVPSFLAGALLLLQLPVRPRSARPFVCCGWTLLRRCAPNSTRRPAKDVPHLASPPSPVEGTLIPG